MNDSILSRLSRGLPAEPAPDLSPAFKSQSDIDKETEQLMWELRASAKIMKFDAPEPVPAAIVKESEKGTGEGEAQSSTPGALADNSLMDMYIYKSFNADEYGKSNETLETVLQKIRKKIPDIEREDLEEHLNRMEEEGKINIDVSVTFNKLQSNEDKKEEQEKARLKDTHDYYDAWRRRISL